MSDRQPGEFESKLARLEMIVKQLEGENVPLDEAVKLFQEGKKLTAECESLLKAAQETVARTAGDTQAP